MNLVFLLKTDSYLTQSNINNFNEVLSNELIAEAVCLEYSIKLHVLRSKSRLRLLVEPRQMIAYIALINKVCTLAIIAEFLRPEQPFNHATILHSKKTMKNLIETDKNISNKYEAINKILGL